MTADEPLRCATGCRITVATPEQWLYHWTMCPAVAPWIRTWAARLVTLDDWRERVGLDP